MLNEAVKIEEEHAPAQRRRRSGQALARGARRGAARAGKPKEAAAAFDASLLRMPNRARSLMGAAQAHAAAGNAAAAAARHATLMTFWKGKAPAAPTTTSAPQR